MQSREAPSVQSLFAEYVAVAVSAGDSFGRYLERGRGAWLARYGYLAAAQIDLALPSLRLVGANAFNGQVNRMDVFRAIMDTCGISAVVETGTCRGATTEHMGKNFSGKIYSCELDPRYFEYAQTRLKLVDNIELYLLDSRKLLEKLFRETFSQNDTIFYYLDAHWNKDLPLLDEISLILSSNIPAVIMIDDFEVPFDEGYGFDTYGSTKKLCLSMLSGIHDRMKYSYFPALRGETETGCRRGSIIVATSANLDQRLAMLSGLRRATERDWNHYAR